MTLQILRTTVGDHDFFKILKVWAQSRAGDNVTTPEFIHLAEHISGQQLDDLFDTWLYTPGKPALPAALVGPSAGRSATPPPAAKVTLELAKKEGMLRR
jgi:aminopeptidase N